MTIRIEKTLNNQTRYPNQESIFLKPCFRHALAQEYRLESVDIEISSPGGLAEKPLKQSLWLPGYLKKTASGRRLIIGAGFEQTGLTSQFNNEQFLTAINTLSQTASSQNIRQLEVRTQHIIPCQHDHSDKVELSIQLDSSCDERLRQFSKSTRRNLRLPFKHGFHYVIGKESQQLNDFYRLYQVCMHNLGSLPHSKDFFATLWQDCHEDIELFIGYMDENPVVASFHFVSKKEIYGAWGCAHPKYKKYSVFLNMLWLILQHCESTGRHSYNLGRTSINSNAYRFKKRLANRERRIHYYCFEPTSENKPRTAIYDAASWLIRSTPPQVMHGLSRKLLHHFY